MESAVDGQQARGRGSLVKTNLALLVVLIALLAAVLAAGPAFAAHLVDTNGYGSVMEGRSVIRVAGNTGYTSALNEGIAAWNRQNVRFDYVRVDSNWNVYAYDESSCGDGFEAWYHWSVPNGVDFIIFDPCYMNGHNLADRTFMPHYYWEDVVTATHELGHGAGVGDHDFNDGDWRSAIDWYCPIDCTNVSAITAHDVYDSNRAP